MTRIDGLKLAAGVVLPAAIFIFIVADRIGVLDRVAGLDHVLEVASRLETSYAEVDRQVGPDEAAWKPLLSLIKEYSIATLPEDMKPRMLARSVAVSSARLDLGSGNFAEWTAPSTPVILIYSEWPGQTVQPDNYRVVGTIADLRIWVDRRRSDRRFMFQDIFLSLLTLVLAGIVWWIEHGR